MKWYLRLNPVALESKKQISNYNNKFSCYIIQIIVTTRVIDFCYLIKTMELQSYIYKCNHNENIMCVLAL